MRKALNDNPMVQLAVIGVLVLVVGLFFMMNMKKSSSGSKAPSESSATPGASTAAPGTTAPPVSSGTSAPPIGSAPTTSGTVSPEALIAGPGLPKPVVDAYKHGDAIVVLIVRGGGIDDRLVQGSVRSLSSEPATSVFVARAADVARYSRITQGVGVNRAPALVVVRPRKESGSVPEAQVSYGFRNSQSVVQAVHDALYHGRDDLPYYPR